jgi:hypothetical protein
VNDDWLAVRRFAVTHGMTTEEAFKQMVGPDPVMPGEYLQWINETRAANARVQKENALMGNDCLINTHNQPVAVHVFTTKIVIVASNGTVIEIDRNQAS